MTPKPISHAAARELILAHRLAGGGRMFQAAFLRRTDSADGERMSGAQEAVVARFGVRSRLASRNAPEIEGAAPIKTRAAYDRHAKNVFCAFVFSRRYAGRAQRVNGYRSIPFDTMTWLKIDGTLYRVGRAPAPQH
jgi:hypothetical protein